MTYEVQCRVYGRNGNWKTVHSSDIKDAAETYAYLADRRHKTKEYRVVTTIWRTNSGFPKIEPSPDPL